MSKTILPNILIVALVLALANCRQEPLPVTPEQPTLPTGTTFLTPSTQRSGNAAAGYQYLIYGDFMSSGIPLQVFKNVFGSTSPDDLDRTGDADGISLRFNVATAANGVKIVAPTCLTCHAEQLNGQFIVGLGSNTYDYTTDQGSQFQLVDQIVKSIYGEGSPEWVAYQPISQAYQSIGPYIRTKVRGPNPADKIFGTLSAHRRADDLTWLTDQQFNVPLEVAPTDVPAWWLMKKKNALYYNALGRGDFARLSTASGMLTMQDSAEARRMDPHFADLMAWIRTIEPPVYPYAIDQNLAAQGQVIFEKTCSKCHGTYGTQETYPNLLVNLTTIGTDPLLSQTYQNYPEHQNWYNGSWYAQGANKGQLLPNNGYIAPPLDGIWATAPYLHNGSVPTLEDLLNSPQRPAFWKRNFDNSAANYNQQKVGWHYTVETAQADANTYNTTLPGYGRGGHQFGDVLSATERQAVVEYLKTR